MKKSILLLAIGMLALTSCKKETLEPVAPEPTVTTPTTPTAADNSIEFIVYDGSGSGTAYNTNLDVYDGTTLVGNLSNHTTTLYDDDLYSVTASQGGLSLEAVVGQGENINIRNAAGDTLVMFGGNFALDAGQLDLPDGFSTTGNTAIRLQSINSGADLIMSIESL